jgi:hypothetical protein
MASILLATKQATMSDAITKGMLDKLSLMLLLSKTSLHNYCSTLAIQSCNLIWKASKHAS